MTRMESRWGTFEAADGVEVHYRYWSVSAPPRAIVQIVHGAAEHSGRYEEFAAFMNAEGYGVYADDHRGHGRTRVGSGELGDAGADAWNAFVTDENRLSQRIRNAHPGVPLVLLGHSLGSFIAQDYITRFPDDIDALILSGTAYDSPPPTDLLSRLDTIAREQPLAASKFWSGLFASFNKPFSEQPGFDWLSRDPEAVAAYERDPLTGFAFSNALVRDHLQGMADVRDPAREANIRRDLPVLVIQGEHDPVGGQLAKTRALLERYAALGMEDVRHHFYPQARHEVLNETNRDAVWADVVAWLDEVSACSHKV